MKKLIKYILILIIIIYSLAPFLWTAISAFKPSEELFHIPVKFIPSYISFEHFKGIFEKGSFLTYIFNSLIVGIGATCLTILIASFISFKLRYVNLEKALRIQRLLLIFAMIPPTLLVIPFFIIMRDLGLINNYLSLILSYTALNLPFAVWLLFTGFKKIPIEIDEAAKIDGFSSLGILFKIILPLSISTVIATSILVFIFCWNEFLFALTMMPDEKKYTVPVGIALLSGTSVYEIPWGEICAGVTFTTAPIVIIIAILQRWILEGLTSGAIKG